MNGLNKTKSAIFVSLTCSLLPEDLHSEFILKSVPPGTTFAQDIVLQHSRFTSLVSFQRDLAELVWNMV